MAGKIELVAGRVIIDGPGLPTGRWRVSPACGGGKTI